MLLIVLFLLQSLLHFYTSTSILSHSVIFAKSLRVKFFPLRRVVYRFFSHSLSTFFLFSICFHFSYRSQSFLPRKLKIYKTHIHTFKSSVKTPKIRECLSLSLSRGKVTFIYPSIHPYMHPHNPETTSLALNIAVQKERERKKTSSPLHPSRI